MKNERKFWGRANAKISVVIGILVKPFYLTLTGVLTCLICFSTISYTASFKNVTVRSSPRCPTPLFPRPKLGFARSACWICWGVCWPASCLLCLLETVTNVWAFSRECVCVCVRATVDTYWHTRPYKANALHEVREVCTNRYKQARLWRVNGSHEVRGDKYKQGRL